MYIAPNSTIKLMTVPFDPDYEHTGYFASAIDQNTYFDSLSGITFTEQYYTRPYRGYIRVEIPADNAYIYNYMRFKNTAYGNKWFYAFITSVKWINNQVTEFGFKIDVMQTWYFDYQLEKCFVVREHASTDEVGDNLVPENIETGDFETEQIFYCENTATGEDLFNEYDIVVISTLDKTGATVFPVHTYGKMYNGLHYIVFKNETVDGVFRTAAEQVSLYLGQTIVGSPDAVQAIFMIPHQFIYYHAHDEDYDFGVYHYTWEINKQTHWTYTYGNKSGPRNNKLYTSPFNTLVVTNNENVSVSMPYEYFAERDGLTPGHGDGKLRFDVSGIPSPYPQFSLIPYGFHLRNPNGKNLAHRIMIDQSPMCAYATDSFRAWMAQNNVMMGISFAQSATNFGLGMLSQAMPLVDYMGAEQAGSFMQSMGYPNHNPNPMDVPMPSTGKMGSLVADFAFDTAKLVATMQQHSYMPPVAHGSGANGLAIANDHFGFMAYAMHVRSEFAAIIDDYFDKYGYACHEVKVPNRHVRKRWTFTKTLGCSIKPSINSNGLPADDANAIQNIYNKGITFWVTPADIGDYSLDNPVLST